MHPGTFLSIMYSGGIVSTSVVCQFYIVSGLYRPLIHHIRVLTIFVFIMCSGVILSTSSCAKHPFLCDIFRFIEKYRNCHTKQNIFLQNKVSFLGAMHHFSVIFFSFSVFFYVTKNLKM